MIARVLLAVVLSRKPVPYQLRYEVNKRLTRPDETHLAHVAFFRRRKRKISIVTASAIDLQLHALHTQM